MAPKLELKLGDKIRLNERAAIWTRGKIFEVDEVKPWGVVCGSRELAGGIAYYRAKWDEIQEPVR